MKFSKYFRKLMVLAFMAALHAPTLAQVHYDMSSWGEDVKAAKWETGAAFAGVTVLGITSWDWGSSKSFKFNSEGWFDKDTGSGGPDKHGPCVYQLCIDQCAGQSAGARWALT